MFKKLRKLATTKIAGIIIYKLARIYSATFRVKIENEADWLGYLEKGGRVLLCAWHQQFFIGVRLFVRYKKFHPTIMSSRSLDGDIAARVAEAAGVFPARGSSSRGGGVAMKEVISRLKKNRLAVHMLDGPRGPAGKVKPGAIGIASGAGAAILPGYFTVDRAWLLNSWDRFVVPKPFARVIIRFCPLIELEPSKGENDFENQRQMLENILKPHLIR